MRYALQMGLAPLSDDTEHELQIRKLAEILPVTSIAAAIRCKILPVCETLSCGAARSGDEVKLRAMLKLTKMSGMPAEISIDIATGGSAEMLQWALQVHRIDMSSAYAMTAAIRGGHNHMLEV